MGDKRLNQRALEIGKALAVGFREGDIAEFFDSVRQMERTGVIVRAAHDRSLDPDTVHLWEHLSVQLIQFYQEVELPETAKRSARKANLAIRFCLVRLRSLRRLDNQNPIEVYAFDTDLLVGQALLHTDLC